nr:hypothetical protein [Aureimonas altamirensis]
MLARPESAIPVLQHEVVFRRPLTCDVEIDDPENPSVLKTKHQIVAAALIAGDILR